MKLVLMYQLKSMKIYPKALTGLAVVCLLVCFPSIPVCIVTGRSFTAETQDVQLFLCWVGFK